MTTKVTVSAVCCGALAVAAYGIYTTRRWRCKKRKDTVLSPAQKMLTRFQNTGESQIVSSVLLQGREGGSSVTKEDVEKCVKILQRRDESLGAAITQNDANELVVVSNDTTRNISGSVVVESGNWKEVFHQVRNQIHFPAPTKESPYTPVWRLVLVDDPSASSCALIFVLNHALFDGTTLKRLVRVFVETLHYDGDRNSEDKIPHSTSRGIVDVAALEDLLPKKSWTEFSCSLLRDICNEYRCRDSLLVLPMNDAPGMANPSSPSETKVIMFEMSESETEDLIQAAKRNGTTVHGALSAAGILALIQLNNSTTKKHEAALIQNRSLHPTFVRTLHSISQWPCLPSQANCRIAGTAVGLKHVLVESSEGDNNAPWTIARRLKQGLGKDPRRGLTNLQLPLYFLGLFSARKLLGKPLPPGYSTLRVTPTICFSNMGKFYEGESSAKGRIRKIHTCVSGHRRPCFGTLYVLTVDGKLNFSWNYYSQIWSDETADEYVNHFRTMLVDMSTK